MKDYTTPTNLSQSRALIWELEDTGRFLIRVALGLDPGMHDGKHKSLDDAAEFLRLYGEDLPEEEAEWYRRYLADRRREEKMGMRMMI